jgi:hypothetical protein
MKRSSVPSFVVFVLVVLTGASRALAGPGSGGPIVKGPWLQHVTPTSAIVRVEVDPPAPVTLELGMSGPPGTADSGAGSVVESREARALHTILVKNLEPSTRYGFTVRAHGAQKYGAITTAPPDDGGAAFRFLIYGDNRTDDAAHAAIVRAMVAAPSDFLINTGDLVENGASPSQWQTFFDIEAPLTRERCIFSCVGNHEIYDGAGVDYARYFGPAEIPVSLPRAASSVAGAPIATPLPPLDAGLGAPTLEQLSGTFRWSNARFFLVNGMVSYTAGPGRAWLERVLAASDAEAGLVWRIVVVHHGPWSSGPHGDNVLLQDAKVPDLLRSHKVDLVMSGHDHIYERGAAGGLAYLVSGGGGAPVYRIKKSESTSRKVESTRHFIDASATAVAIQFVATRPDGSTIERCALRKNAGWDCDDDASAKDAGPAGGPSAGAARVPSSAADPSTSSRCACRAAGADAAYGGGTCPPPALLGAGALLGALLGRRVKRRQAPRSVR